MNHNTVINTLGIHNLYHFILDATVKKSKKKHRPRKVETDHDEFSTDIQVRCVILYGMLTKILKEIK